MNKESEKMVFGFTEVNYVLHQRRRGELTEYCWMSGGKPISEIFHDLSVAKKWRPSATQLETCS